MGLIRAQQQKTPNDVDLSGYRHLSVQRIPTDEKNSALIRRMPKPTRNYFGLDEKRGILSTKIPPPPGSGGEMPRLCVERQTSESRNEDEMPK